MTVSSALRIVRLLIAAGGLAFTAVTPAIAAGARYLPTPPASIYTYDGNVYDRLFSSLQRALSLRFGANIPRVRQARAFAAPPYAVTDLESVYQGSDGTLSGFPTSVNNSGRITFYDECECFSGEDYQYNAGVVVDDVGNTYATFFALCCAEGVADTIVYAINNVNFAAGYFSYGIRGSTDTFSGNVTWTPVGGILYFDGADNGSVALAINDENESVGQDVGSKGTFAGAYTPLPRGGFKRTLLLPPRNTSWVGTATGINDAGEIVGYGTFGSNGRALRFSEKGYAQVLPVGAAGVSTSAQAINVHGDVVGNAGSQAYLYKNNRVTYLPRPPGETAGNAIAYAINASDEIVGNIVTSTSETAFLYVNGRSYDLNSLLPNGSGWDIGSAVSINDSGQIVGEGADANNPSGGSYSMKPQLPADARTMR